MAFEKYLTEIPGWATSLQVVQTAQEGEPYASFDVRLERNPDFVVAVLSTAGGQRPPWLFGRASLSADGEIRFNGGRNEGMDRYADDRGTLFVINNPMHSLWHINVEALSPVPVELNFLGFHPHNHVAAGQPPSGRCRACKITVKALALAITAAATLPALPAALIAAVASYLGVTALVAATFIGSVLGDSADIIAEKLCLRVGLCP